MIDLNSNDPFGLFRQWMADAEKSEPEDPNAMALATADASGVPSVRMVLLKGIDAGIRLLYQSRKPQGRAACRKPQRRPVLPLEVAETAGPRRRPGRSRERRGGRRILPQPPPRQSDRRLGIPAVPSAGRTLGVGEAGGRVHREACDRHDPPAAALVRLPRSAQPNRVLARPAVPASRSGGLPPRRRTWWGPDGGWTTERLFP